MSLYSVYYSSIGAYGDPAGKFWKGYKTGIFVGSTSALVAILATVLQVRDCDFSTSSIAVRVHSVILRSGTLPITRSSSCVSAHGLQLFVLSMESPHRPAPYSEMSAGHDMDKPCSPPPRLGLMFKVQHVRSRYLSFPC